MSHFRVSSLLKRQAKLPRRWRISMPHASCPQRLPMRRHGCACRIQSTRRPDCLGSVARRAAFHSSARLLESSMLIFFGEDRSGGCRWWPLVLDTHFHSRGENFHAGRFSRPLCDCTATAGRVRRRPIFPAKTTLRRRESLPLNFNQLLLGRFNRFA